MILITGLDGSGKSTILNRLETDLENQISVLRVPTIEAEKFKDNTLLYRQCVFINRLGERADKEGIHARHLQRRLSGDAPLRAVRLPVRGTGDGRV